MTVRRMSRKPYPELTEVSGLLGTNVEGGVKVVGGQPSSAGRACAISILDEGRRRQNGVCNTPTWCSPSFEMTTNTPISLHAPALENAPIDGEISCPLAYPL